MSTKYLLFFAATIAISSAQTEQTIPNILEKVSLPPELQGKVDLKDVEEAQTKALNEFKTRCEKNGGPDAYQIAQNGTKELYQCFSSLVDFATLQAEVENAKPNGSVDEVFKKYCAKKPEFEECVKDFTDSSSPCFSDKEQGHLKTLYNVSQDLADFVCFKEGDRIALFIAEGGQECFQAKQEGLRECVNKTIGLQGDLNVNSVSDVTISFDEKQCQQIWELQKCVVKVLEGCPKPTSANIVESLFKFVRKSTPCKSFLETQKDNAATFYVTAATLVTALFVTVLV